MIPFATIIDFIFPFLAYLSGSVPFGFLLTRAFTSKDIRHHGSGNIGATNVNRIAGVKLGLATLFADAAKAAIPIFLAQAVIYAKSRHPELFIAGTALCAFLGHLYPCFLGFKGGKGVATAAGCFIVISPLAWLIAFPVFVFGTVLTKRVSVGSLSGALALPVGVWWATGVPVFTFCAGIMTVFIFLRHGENIRRLIAGTERRLR